MRYILSYYAAVFIGRITCCARPSVRQSVCPSVLFCRDLTQKRKIAEKPILLLTSPEIAVTGVLDVISLQLFL